MKIHEIGWTKEWGGVRLGAVLHLDAVPCSSAQIRQVVQVHGNHVVDIDDDSGFPEQEADALWTAETGVALVIRTADCVPVHLVDKVGVATIHAGWRGARAGILQSALQRFEVDETIAVIGPCICKHHYQVDEDLYGDWLVEDPHLGGFLEPSGDHPSKRQLDLAGFVRHLLMREGLTSDHIHSVDKCTYNSAALPSYRRDKSKARIYNYTMKLPK